MTQVAVLNPTYQRVGIILEADRLTVDLAEPRTVVVYGVNARTGETKNYLLRVTQSGKLVLQ